MQYEDIHNKIISRAIEEKRVKNTIYERHHIIPKSIGGSNHSCNMVYLTTREHFIIHKLLIKIYHSRQEFGNRNKMIYAFWWMCKTRTNKKYISSHDYEYARKLYSENNPNKDESRKKEYKRKLLAGEYKHDNTKAAINLKESLLKMSQEEMKKRLENSLWKCDHTERSKKISIGKASQFRMCYCDNTYIDFWTYDDIEKITGYNRSHIIYRINRYNGILLNGNKITYLYRYSANDKLRGRNIPKPSGYKLTKKRSKNYE